MKSVDRLSALFFILLSVTICFATLKLQGWSFESPGPIIFPLLLGLSLFILSIIFFVQSGTAPPSSFSALFPKEEGLKVIYLLGVFFLCAVTLEQIGFVVSIFALMVLLLTRIGGKRIAGSIFFSLITSLAIYLIFTRLLGIRLPRGVLWF